MTNCKSLEQVKREQGKASGTEILNDYVQVSDTKLAYVEKGEGHPVVFVHGGLSDLRVWSEQHNLVSQYYKSVSYSRRHHYPNERADNITDYSLSSHAEDLIQFLKALNFKKVHLVGRCYGASLALLVALQQPELVGSLVLGEPGLFTDCLDEEGKMLLSKQKRGFNEVVELIRRDKKEWAIRQFLNVIIGADVLDQLSNPARSIVMENAETLEPMLRAYYQAPLLSGQQLKQMTIPTLLVSGEFSPRISRLNNEKINACLPDSEVVILQGASHGLHMENPEGFNRLLLEFLSNH